MSAPELLHLALATAAAAAALWAWLAARPAEAGGAAALPFARATTSFAAVTGVQLVAGLWVLGRLPLRAGRALVGGEALPTAALVLALAACLSAIRLGWTAHRRPAPRRTAVALALHLLVLGLCMAAMVEAVGRGLPPGP